MKRAKGIILICARGGSKGFPNKNIKPILGKPLILYSIDLALRFSKKYNFDIAISSDSESILEIVRAYGIDVNYKRPKRLGEDHISKVDVWRDLLFFEEKRNENTYEVILDLDVTSPLRNIDDLEEAYRKLIQDYTAYNIFSVSDAKKNPYFNMVEVNEGYAVISKDLKQYHTRQSAPEVFDVNGSFYFMRRSFFDENFKTVITPKTLLHIMSHICIDIDERIDYEFIQFIIENNKLDFDFE